MKELRPFAIGGATRPDALTGFNPRFATSLSAMFASAPPEIQAQLRIASGYRSPDVQAALYRQALAKYGNEITARKWVAPPGRSQHNHGNAADLKYLSPAAREWAHANAPKFGLAFPLAHENWHIELAGARGQPAGAPQPNAAPQTIAAAFLPNSPMPAGAAETPTPAPVAGLGETLADAFLSAPSMSAPVDPQYDRRAAERARREALFGDNGLIASLYA